jgi:hypothetical protein
MKDMLDIPDDDMRRKLQGYSEDPDDSVWSNIASRLKEGVPLRDRLQTYAEEPDDFLWSSINSGVSAERSLLWLERAGRVVAVVAFLMLIFPFVNNDRTTVDIANNSNINDGHLENEEIKTPNEGRTGTTLTDHQAKNHHSRAHDNLTEPDATRPNLNNQNPSDGADPNTTTTTTRRQRSGNSESTQTLKNDATRTANINLPGTPMSEEKNISDERKKTVLEGATLTNDQQGLTTMVDSTANELNEIPEKIAEEQKTAVKADQKEKKKRKLPTGLYVLLMPTFGYQHITPVKDDNILIESIEKVSAFSTKRLGIRAEAGIERLLARKFSYHVGLLYYQRKQTINYIFRDPAYAQVERISSQGYVYQVTLPADSGTFEYELKNIGVVIGLNYTTKIRKFTHKVGIAGELHKSLNQVDNEVDTGQRYFAFADLYYRLSYPVSRRIDVMFQPTINYALQLDNRINAPFYVKPYGLGLNFGAYFHF